MVQERCPFLFAARPVFVSDRQATNMAAVVRAIEAVVALPSYREHVLADAPSIARHDPGGARGVFFGYDFHVAGERLGLIEINTNAGGAMLNAVMAKAHHACCLNEDQLAYATACAASFESRIVDMFLNEWKLSRRLRPLRSIAIVDTDPRQQYLYPEFLLFKHLFELHGLKAVIVAPAELELHDGILIAGGVGIDLVYNRLTDFMLQDASSSVLRRAYLENAVVLTPHPQAHALYADKRNLAVLSSSEELQALDVPADVRDVLLAHVLQTEIVEPAEVERFWIERRQLFFKPAAGFGSKAAYRGDKLTKRAWQDILAGDYVAQAIMAPGVRSAGTRASPDLHKFDIRCYAYSGDVQWTAARLYQGQTTNFRTPAGGFAPVYPLPDAQVGSATDRGSHQSSEPPPPCGQH